MIRLVFISLLLGVALTSSSWGQATDGFDYSDDPFAEDVRAPQPEPTSTPETPESSYSSGYEQIPDAKTLIYRNAASRAAQRRHRIASMRWFGYSNLRPVASTNPNYNRYSPMWGGNTWDPYRWVGVYSIRPY